MVLFRFFSSSRTSFSKVFWKHYDAIEKCPQSDILAHALSKIKM